ncbi:hypothetical protein BDB00DRAFT_854578 [Zychaea mexicana]|uniref:uncharacterized protein n=1 Tax=Zychaea mexicana TaxID=64656 RepID=UPI0022FE35A3|nr:uncharacterized protein BDB00DRAFT_854578 [Zychaea mexicana]KAI9484597.1 hypothetical protein BDB00DRAFT_854578 [Zychaea mexicana]
MAMDAILRYTPDRRIVAVNSFFFKPGNAGPCIVEVKELKSSERNFCVAQVVLKQHQQPQQQLLSSIDDYNPSLYTAKLHTIITTASSSYDSASFHIMNNDPASPVFDNNMQPSPIMELFLRASDVITIYENHERSYEGEVWHALEWPHTSDGQQLIDIKSLACFADLLNITKPYAQHNELVRLPRMTLQMEIKFRPLPVNPIQRVLAKVIMSDLIDGFINGDVWLFDQNGYLLANVRHQMAVETAQPAKKKANL